MDCEAFSSLRHSATFLTRPLAPFLGTSTPSARWPFRPRRRPEEKVVNLITGTPHDLVEKWPEGARGGRECLILDRGFSFFSLGLGVFFSILRRPFWGMFVATAGFRSKFWFACPWMCRVVTFVVRLEFEG